MPLPPVLLCGPGNTPSACSPAVGQGLDLHRVRWPGAQDDTRCPRGLCLGPLAPYHTSWHLVGVRLGGQQRFSQETLQAPSHIWIKHRDTGCHPQAEPGPLGGPFTRSPCPLNLYHRVSRAVTATAAHLPKLEGPFHLKIGIKKAKPLKYFYNNNKL